MPQNKDKTLNQLVRQEKTASENYQARSADITKTLKDQRHRFQGYVKTYEALREGDQELPVDRKEVGATLLSELKDFLREFFLEAVSTAVQKEESNCLAKADLLLFDQTWPQLPVGALLSLEGKLGRLKKILVHMPTLDDNKEWKVHDNANGIYTVHPVEWKYRTAKMPYNHIKAPATDKHAAQVEVLYRDENIGKWYTKIFSGACSIEVKAKVLANVDKAIAAVVDARERANLSAAAAPQDFSALFDAIMKPLSADFQGKAKEFLV